MKCHSRLITGVIDQINYGSVPFSVSQPIQGANVPYLSGAGPYLIVLITPVFTLRWHGGNGCCEKDSLLRSINRQEVVKNTRRPFFFFIEDLPTRNTRRSWGVMNTINNSSEYLHLYATQSSLEQIHISERRMDVGGWHTRHRPCQLAVRRLARRHYVTASPWIWSLDDPRSRRRRPSQCDSEPASTCQRPEKLKRLNGIQPSLILSLPLFLLSKTPSGKNHNLRQPNPKDIQFAMIQKNRGKR